MKARPAALMCNSSLLEYLLIAELVDQTPWEKTKLMTSLLFCQSCVIMYHLSFYLCAYKCNWKVTAVYRVTETNKTKQNQKTCLFVSVVWKYKVRSVAFILFFLKLCLNAVIKNCSIQGKTIFPLEVEVVICSFERKMSDQHALKLLWAHLDSTHYEGEFKTLPGRAGVIVTPSTQRNRFNG